MPNKLILIVALFSLNCTPIKIEENQSDLKQSDFEQTIYSIIKLYNNNDQEINQYINKYLKLAHLYRRGAHDNIQFNNQLNFKQPIPEYLPYDRINLDGLNSIVYEELPTYDCESWNKQGGIYTDTIKNDFQRSTVMRNERRDELNNWSDEEILTYEAIEKSSRKIIVLDKNQAELIFYLTLHNNKWYLTAIDRFEVCSA